MHPRNRYKDNPLNFAELGHKFPYLHDHLTYHSQDRAILNFTNQAALRCLTKAVLDQDFSIIWDIPEDFLIPTVPQRLNYVHWIEDIITETEGMIPKGDDVIGIDIGVGASCIYPLLLARMNGWKVFGIVFKQK